MTGKYEKRGKLYGIGVGPGEPGLLTLKAFNALKESDLVFIPKADLKKESLAYQIIKEVFELYGPSKKDLPPARDLIFPMEKDPEKLKPYWEEAKNIITKELDKNKTLSLVTLGDPTLYSTYCYILNEINYSSSEYFITTIPGIYSFSAISSKLNLPLAQGEEKVLVVPVEKEKSYTEELSNYENIIFMKASANFQGLINDLEKTKRLSDGILISRVGQEGEKINRDLEKLKEKKIDYFSTLIVNPRIPMMVGDKYAGK